MKMTWLQLFGLVLFSAQVYGRSQLVAIRSLVEMQFQSFFDIIIWEQTKGVSESLSSSEHTFSFIFDLITYR